MNKLLYFINIIMYPYKNDVDNIESIFRINNLNNEIIISKNRIIEILDGKLIYKKKILYELYILSQKMNDLSNNLIDIEAMEDFYLRCNMFIINLSMIIEYINNFPEIIKNEDKNYIKNYLIQNKIF